MATKVWISRLDHDSVIGHPTLESLARKHDATEPQIALAWLREKGVTAIPKATSEAQIRDNAKSFELSLDTTDIEQIDTIQTHERTVHPDFAPAA